MSALDQAIQTAKTAPASMLPTIIEQVLNNANVYVFGEILTEPKVAAMKTGDAGAKKSFATLELFAYSTFNDYQKNKAKFIDLKPKMLDKLKMLSLTDLCMKNSSITFDQIKSSTGCASNDEAEELVLKCVQSQLFQVRIDQRNKNIIVLNVNSNDGRGRDVPISSVKALVQQLEEWENTSLKNTQEIFDVKVRKELDTAVQNNYSN